MTLLYSAVQRLVVLQIQLQVDVNIRSHLTSYAKFVAGSLKSIRRPIGHRNGHWTVALNTGTGNSILHHQECFDSKTTEEVLGSSAQRGTDSEAQGQVLEALSKALMWQVERFCYI
ncbi:hypothetical protein DPMN_127697 [Dreissena polymorpha]|uniref:Uncharacterized protein n=1 Tax=Dreissena polymorpha TaxID=45954 RepID=A0A9D4JWQ7_DREPO|nr:hypothetical protein DPMN_127697 [Dreissena polymorpha]